MKFLDELDIYLTEDKSPFDLYPVNYDMDSGVSFGVDNDEDSDEPAAKVIIRTLDGTPIDALAGDYDYNDVYVDVQIDGDINDPKNKELVSWITNKMKSIGYNEDTMKIDGENYYENPDEKNMDINNMDEPVETDSDLDVDNYWGSYDIDDAQEDSMEDSDDEFDIDKELSSPEFTTAKWKDESEEENEETLDSEETQEDDEEDEDADEESEDENKGLK